MNIKTTSLMRLFVIMLALCTSVFLQATGKCSCGHGRSSGSSHSTRRSTLPHRTGVHSALLAKNNNSETPDFAILILVLGALYAITNVITGLRRYFFSSCSHPFESHNITWPDIPVICSVAALASVGLIYYFTLGYAVCGICCLIMYIWWCCYKAQENKNIDC